MTPSLDTAARLLPRPTRLEPKPGLYFVSPAAGLRVKGYPGDADALFAVLRHAGLDVRFETATADGPYPAFTLDRPGDCRREQAERQLVSLLDTISNPAVRGQAYVLETSPAGSVAVAGGEAGLFYAAVTLSKLLAPGATIPCLTIQDQPALPARAVLLDVSRGRVPTLSTLKEFVALLADLKFNQLTFNLEHTFACPAHPVIGAGHDPLTAKELKALSEFAAARHVEIIPFQQSFGHLRGILSLPDYQRLAYDRRYQWSLDPSNDDVYRLLADLYDAQLSAAPSRFFHVGGDEPFDLIKYYDPARFKGRSRAAVIRDHYLKLHELVTARGRTMMLWADAVVAHPEILPDLPRDVVLCHWDYGTGALEGPERYRPALELLSASGHPFYACTCTWSMMKIFPDLAIMRANHEGMVPLAKQLGAAGHMVTIWGDMGHMNLLGLETYPLAYAAKHAWEDQPHFDESFAPAYSWTVFSDPDNTSGAMAENLDQVNQLLKGPAGMGGIGFLLFFDEPLHSGLLSLFSNPNDIWEKLCRLLSMEDNFYKCFEFLKEEEEWKHKTKINHRLEFWLDYRLVFHQLYYLSLKFETIGRLNSSWPGQPQEEHYDDLLRVLEGVFASGGHEVRKCLGILEERWLANATPSDLEANRERFRKLMQAWSARWNQISSYPWIKRDFNPPTLAALLAEPAITYKFNPLEEMGLVGLL